MRKLQIRSTSQGLGNYISYDKNEASIQFITDFGTLHLTFFSEKMVQVWAYHGIQDKEFSYAVVGEPIPLKYAVSEQAEFLWITTSALKIKINKSPMRISIMDLKDQLIKIGRAHV